MCRNVCSRINVTQSFVNVTWTWTFKDNYYDNNIGLSYVNLLALTISIPYLSNSVQ